MQKATQVRINLSCNLKSKCILQNEKMCDVAWQEKRTTQAKNGVLSKDMGHKNSSYVQETVNSLVGGIENI